MDTEEKNKIKKGHWIDIINEKHNIKNEQINFWGC